MLKLLNKFLVNIAKGQMRPHSNSGFTLIELMVCILIVSILSSIALSISFAQIRKAKYTEVMLNLNFCKKSQASFYLENLRFTENLEVLGIARETHNFIYQASFYSIDIEGRTVSGVCCMGGEKLPESSVPVVISECIREDEM
jgi:prepilin-type N-terminal cleavage/methylation domain-containing protein